LKGKLNKTGEDMTKKFKDLSNLLKKYHKIGELYLIFMIGRKQNTEKKGEKESRFRTRWIELNKSLNRQLSSMTHWIENVYSWTLI
jgi:hypothetical protein